MLSSVDVGSGSARSQTPDRRPSHGRGWLLAGGVSLTLAGTALIGVGYTASRPTAPVQQAAPLWTSPAQSSSAASSAAATSAPTALLRAAAALTPTASSSVRSRTPSSGPATVYVRVGGNGDGGAAAQSSAPAAQAPADQPPAGIGNVDLAFGRPVTATSEVSAYYGVSNITDGDMSSYWEGSANSFPQVVAVDLGSVQWVAEVVLALPPVSSWGTRSQTLAIAGSDSGPSAQTAIVGSRTYTFDANDGSEDRDTVSFAPVRTRYLVITFTGTQGWDAAQLAELIAYS